MRDGFLTQALVRHLPTSLVEPDLGISGQENYILSNLTGQQHIKRDDKYYHNSYASAAWGIYLKPRTD